MYKSKNLLSTNNSKTIKGEKLGYTTYILYLAPHTQNSKGINLCSHASPGCAKACLFNSGAARFDNVQKGKRNKTEWYLQDREGFMLKLDAEITAIKNKRKHATSENTPVVRLNGTSDVPFEKFIIRDNKNIFDLHPEIQFYDYTKNHIRFTKKLPSNYHLTFSMSETNKDKSMELLSLGANVAIVFGVKNANQLPETYKGYEVINGDESDLRFLDKQNVIVGLKYKLITGKGTKGQNKENLEENDFIVTVEDELEMKKSA
tara:strand:- start:1166 stop:1948 length:783 start_codon:yes stop_codon:yes gene_type:complete